jgi:hypothetical protein
MQVLYYLSHTLTLFALVTFQIGSQVFVWDWPQTAVLLLLPPK